MKKYIFDSCAIISYLDGEHNAVKIAELFQEINDHDDTAYLSMINLGEIYYHFLRTGGESTGEIALKTIQTLPLTILGIDYRLTIEAAQIKAYNKMSYADCFAAASAKLNKASLVTSDKEFKQIEKNIKIYWI